MPKKILATGFALLSLMLPLKATAASFDGIYVFSDSLSDNGNLYNYIGIPPTPYYNGHFSNGSVWVEYLAKDLGLPLYDFAYGGATTGLYNAFVPVPTSSSPPLQSLLYQTGILSQVNNFTAPFIANQQSVDPNALYIVWGGANDYFNAAPTANPAQIVSQTVDNIDTEVTSLAAVGAKNFLLPNLGNLGLLPGTRNAVVSNGLSNFTTAHNSALALSLDSLSQKLNGVNIIPFDISNLFDKVMENPGEFGFTDVTNACLPDSQSVVQFPFKTIPSQTSECSNPDQFFFWDEIHSTTAIHRVIANAALSVLNDPQSVPEPVDELGILTFAALGAVTLYKHHQKKASPVQEGEEVRR